MKQQTRAAAVIEYGEPGRYVSRWKMPYGQPSLPEVETTVGDPFQASRLSIDLASDVAEYITACRGEYARVVELEMVVRVRE